MKKLFKNLLSSDSWSKHFSETVKRMGKNNAGFSLVELIVVIAIMAILAAVAVVGFSVYIPRAEQAADKQLANDVADAMVLHYYANPGITGGYVVLVPEGTTYPVGSGEAYQIGAAAMEATYGANWKDSMFLKSDKWVDSGLLSTVLSQDDADVVLGSSYMNGSTPADLLDDVSDLTGSALKFLTNVPRDMWYSGMRGQFGFENDADFKELCDRYGIEVVENDGEYDFGSSVTEQQLANFMVAASANDFTGYKESNFNDDEYALSNAGQIVFMVARYKAFACSEYASTTDKAAYETLLTDLDSATSMAEVNTALETFETAVRENYDMYTGDAEGAEDSQVADNDFLAFVNIMETVDSLSGEVAGNLNDSDLFASGNKVAGYFDTYISAVSVRDEILNMSLPEGSIVIFLQANGEQVKVTSTVADILAN